ncbi:MAG TPA: PASTA domain-containing protein [Flavobacteriaceae bacterium]|nr:PASTA domain-containing protein [Flavobacteriaceae bacterium]
MSIQKKNILNKLYPFAVVLFLFALAIVYKLVDIQLIRGDLYKEEAQKRVIRNFNIPANRGNVYSADGSLLATSVSRFDIYMDLVTVSKGDFEKYIKDLSIAMSKMFSKSAAVYESRLRKAKKNKNRYFLIAKNLSYTDYIKVRNFPLFKLGPYRGGFIKEQKTVRERPIGRIAERTIGWDEKRIGVDGKEFPVKVGLEGNFRDYLRGKDGKRLKQKIAKGQWKPIFDAQEMEPVNGRDIVTTIDVNIQDIAHHTLLFQLEKFKAEHGTVVVMETKTGEIKAISNLGRTKSGKYYERLNYAIGESHEPGSTFKLMSMVVALEDKVIDSNTIVDTEKGKWKVGNRIVTDSHNDGYGKISAGRVLEVSSNVGIAKIIHNNYKSNPQKFIDGLNRMEVGFQLNIPIKGEGKAFLPSPKIKNKWYGTSLAWMSFGYGVSITPLQTLAFYNAIANNGKMVKPMFVKAIKQQDKVLEVFETEVINEKICSQSTIDKVNKMLQNVVKKGTAKNIYNKDYFLAGKTGTCLVDYGKGGEQPQYIASFAGFFPADNPKYSCIVVIHKPDTKLGYYGNTVAAPVFAKIAQKLYTDTPIVEEFEKLKTDYVALEKSEIRYNINTEKQFSTMPNLNGMVGMDAISLLENLGLRVSFEGSGKVKKQSLKVGEKIKKGMAITLIMS